MYELVELLESQPTLRKVNLQFKDVAQITPTLFKFKFLAELSFHGNKITTLPSLQTLKHLRAMDLTNNPIKIDKFLLDSLSRISKLEQLHIDCTRQQKQSICQNLPNLKSINGQTINRQKFHGRTLQQQLKILEDKLLQEMKKMKQTYAKMVQSIQSLETSNIGRQSRTVRDQQFNMIFKDIQDQMNYFYSGLQDKLSRQGVFAYCKNKMTVILDNFMIKILDQTASQTIVKIYQEVSKIKSQNFDLLLRIIFNTAFENHVNQQVEKPSNRLRKQTIYQNQIFRLKKQIGQLKKQQQKIQIIAEKQKITKEKIIRPVAKSPTNQRTIDKSNSTKNIVNKSPSARSLVKGQTQTMSRSPSAKIPTRPYNNSNNFERTPKSTSHSKNSKFLTLDQLTKLIEEIMLEKRKFNVRCLTKNEPFQTSQQFIFTFFSRKYGLKQVALQWSLSIIKAIQIYCKQSIQIEIFGKILKNQLYQQYYDEFKSFNKQVQRVYKQSKINKSNINENIFRKLFFYFFSYQNQQTFIKISKTFNFPITQIQHQYFLQSYKLAFQEKHLVSFIRYFEGIDSNDDSALTAKQSKQLLHNLIQANQQIIQQNKSSKFEQFSAIIDTFKKNKFIFSQLFQIAHPLL